MNRFFKFFTICFAVSTLAVSCAKKPLTLDNNTSMKTLLKANDEKIKELIVKEATEKANTPCRQVRRVLRGGWINTRCRHRGSGKVIRGIGGEPYGC